jgi:hypothetical protein
MSNLQVVKTLPLKENEINVWVKEKDSSYGRV